MLLLGLGATLSPEVGHAQSRRAGSTVYVKVGAGLSDYAGENDGTPVLDDITDVGEFFDLEKFRDSGPFPYAVVGEVGYQFVPALGVGLGYQFGQYPFADGIPFTTDPTLPGAGGDLGTARHVLQALGRYTFKAKDWIVAPYLDAGVNATFGGKTPAFGPSVGVGIDVSLGDRTSLFFESRVNFTLGDEAVDGIDTETPLDALSALPVLGFKRTVHRPATPPRVLALNCPATLQAQASAAFTARINVEEATRPIRTEWTFGDGTTGSGDTVSHTFQAPGTYTVTFTARNDAGTARETCTVEVTPVPQPAIVNAIDASPNPVEVGTPVRFQSEVEGAAPLSYEWDFGDGGAGRGAAPTHTYDAPGEYAVRLRASNDDGADQDTLTVQVNRARPAICETVQEFNSVFFAPGSSALSGDAREALRENADVLLECPDLPVRLDGYAAQDEPNPQALSEDRAEAVADFYEEAGVDPDRLQVEGRGAVGGVATKKGGARQFRRVDTVPVRDTTGARDADPQPPGESGADSSLRDTDPGADGAEWGLVVASLRDARAAADVARGYRPNFAPSSLSVGVRPVDLNGERRHRVVVGPFDRARKAQALYREQEARLPADAWPLRLR